MAATATVAKRKFTKVANTKPRPQLNGYSDSRRDGDGVVGGSGCFANSCNFTGIFSSFAGNGGGFAGDFTSVTGSCRGRPQLWGLGGATEGLFERPEWFLGRV